jgi:sugar (pentulose or hexulose) kinase
MTYHSWLKDENIELPEPKPGNEATISKVNGQEVAIGSGLHDSSSSIIPLLKATKGSNSEFILLSTGTWIICMNPFSKEKLTDEQLKNNCLCFMTPEKKQIKSSMQILGRIHEVNAVELSNYFDVERNHFLKLKLKKSLCNEIMSKPQALFFPNEIGDNFKGELKHLDSFSSYESAYYQLIYEICERVHKGITKILDTNNNLKIIYITGGFNVNDVFVEFLRLMMPNQKIKFPKGKNASALGAAMLMEQYI